MWWHSHATAVGHDRSISPRRSDLIAPDARKLRIRSVTVGRRPTEYFAPALPGVSSRTSWPMRSRRCSSQRANRASTGCSALQAAPSWNCVSTALTRAWSACRIAGLLLKAAQNRKAAIREPTAPNRSRGNRLPVRHLDHQRDGAVMRKEHIADLVTCSHQNRVLIEARSQSDPSPRAAVLPEGGYEFHRYTSRPITHGEASAAFSAHR